MELVKKKMFTISTYSDVDTSKNSGPNKVVFKKISDHFGQTDFEKGNLEIF